MRNLSPALSPSQFRGALLRTLGGVLVLFLLVLSLASYFRADLQAFAASFVLRFGLPGFFAGTFVADALSVPVPPQFYFFTAVAAGGPQLPYVVTVILASLAAGPVAYHLARRVAAYPLLADRLHDSRRQLEALFQRYGHWAILVGSLSPLPFSLCCYAAGIYRMPPRLFLGFLLLRVPRLLFLYFIIRAGWG